MAKHSIYLNDYVERLYSSYKDQLNLSELLSGSIAYHTAKLQIIGEAKTDAQEIVKRLLKEKDEDSLAGQKCGLRSGITWAEEIASLGDLEHVVRNGHKALDEFFWERYDDFSLQATYIDNMPKSNSWSSSWDEGYISGFVQGAKTVWDKVEEHVT